MQVFRVRGKNLNEALRRARAEHGENALVLGQEQDGAGDVTLAVTRAVDPDREAEPSRKRRRARSGGGAGNRPPRVEASAETARKVLPRSVTRGVQPRPGGQPAASSAGLREIEERLRSCGCSPAFVRDVCADAGTMTARGQHPIDAAATALGARFGAVRSPRLDGVTRVMAFVGPPGVGKTATLAKLGRRLVESGRRVAFATADTRRVGAVGELQSRADELEVPLHVIRDGSQLNQRALAGGRHDAVLLDTPGCSPTSTEEIELLREVLSRAGSRIQLDVYLVISATSSPGALELSGKSLGALKPAGCVITNLDGTRQPGPALEFAARSGIGVAFLCDGGDRAGHLHRATPELCADLLLRGRL